MGRYRTDHWAAQNHTAEKLNNLFIRTISTVPKYQMASSSRRWPVSSGRIGAHHHQGMSPNDAFIIKMWVGLAATTIRKTSYRIKVNVYIPAGSQSVSQWFSRDQIRRHVYNKSCSSRPWMVHRLTAYGTLKLCVFPFAYMIVIGRSKVDTEWEKFPPFIRFMAFAQKYWNISKK